MNMVDRIFSNDSSILYFPLTLLSYIFAAVTSIRAVLYGNGFCWFRPRKVDATVISIGNITVGGTGKTPMVIFLGRLLEGMGRRVAVSSRGYGRKNPGRQVLVSDAESILVSPESAGEEPYLIAQKLPMVPLVSGSDRYRAAKWLVDKFRPEIILLDDGFQHLRLKRDINLLLIDATNPFGNGHLLPRGPLREPLSALSRATAVIITRREQVSGDSVERIKERIRLIAPELPVFTADFSPLHIIDYKTGGSNRSLSFIRNMDVVAFAGIGNPASFESDLKRLGARVVLFKAFRDHHRYTDDDLQQLITYAKSVKAGIITTEKDVIKIGAGFRKELLVLSNGVVEVSDRNNFLEFLKEHGALPQTPRRG